MAHMLDHMPNPSAILSKDRYSAAKKFIDLAGPKSSPTHEAQRLCHTVEKC